jgi:hypothetical protein
MLKFIVRLIDGYDIQDAINSAYSNYSIEDTAFIVRSNKRANQYNEANTTKILDKESELSGDFFDGGQKQLFWLKRNGEAGFIANGDIIEISKFLILRNCMVLSFAKVKMRMVDYPKEFLSKPFYY